MSGSNSISILSLFMASSLVIVTIFFSYTQKLKLEKEIIISVIRAIIQLVAVGYVLEYIFGLDSPVFTSFHQKLPP